MERSRLSGYIILAIAAMLLPTCGPPATPRCTPSTFDSFPETLDPCSKIIQLQWLGWVEREPVPEFTLLADGNVYYRRGQTADGDDEYYLGGETMVAHLKPEEALALVQSVLDLGFECPTWRPEPKGQVYRTDQPMWHLEVRLPNGELRGIKDDYENSVSPDELVRIRRLLRDYQHPEAQPYTRGAACPSADVDCCTDLGNIR
jgi:hypothetical protein